MPCVSVWHALLLCVCNSVSGFPLWSEREPPNMPVPVSKHHNPLGSPGSVASSPPHLFPVVVSSASSGILLFPLQQIGPSSFVCVPSLYTTFFPDLTWRRKELFLCLLFPNFLLIFALPYEGGKNFILDRTGSL